MTSNDQPEKSLADDAKRREAAAKQLIECSSRTTEELRRRNAQRAITFGKELKQDQAINAYVKASTLIVGLLELANSSDYQASRDELLCDLNAALTDHFKSDAGVAPSEPFDPRR